MLRPYLPHWSHTHFIYLLHLPIGSVKGLHVLYLLERMKLRERIPHTWTSYNENYLKSSFDSVSYCVVILTMTPHWSVRMASRNFTVAAFFEISQNTQHLQRAKLASATLAVEVELIENSHCQNSAILLSSEDAATDETGSIEQYRPLRSMYIILHQ